MCNNRWVKVELRNVFGLAQVYGFKEIYILYENLNEFQMLNLAFLPPLRQTLICCSPFL